MLKISTTKLLAAVQKAPVFEMPAVSEGTAYLYNNLYVPLSRGEDVCLSNLDLSAFDIEDIRDINDLYNDVIERFGYKAAQIVSVLRGIDPVCKPVVYV